MATREEFVAKVNEICDNHSVYVGGGNGELVKDLTFGKVYAMEKNYGRRDSEGKPLWGSDMRRDCTFIGKQYEKYGDEGMKNAEAVDCSGLEVSALRALKVIGENDDFRARDFQKMSDPIELKDLQAGDLVFDKPQNATHMATFIGEGGLVVESRGRDYGVQRRPLAETSFVIGGRLEWFDDSVPPLTRYLRYVDGNLMRGEDVRQCQQQLIKKGYNPGTPDSVFGKKTESAVVAFQKANGLEGDGIVGPCTWAALWE